VYSLNLGKFPFNGNVNNKYDVTHPTYENISNISYKKQVKIKLNKGKSHQK
jgi:hypothetical protein